PHPCPSATATAGRLKSTFEPQPPNGASRFETAVNRRLSGRQESLVHHLLPLAARFRVTSFARVPLLMDLNRSELARVARFRIRGMCVVVPTQRPDRNHRPELAAVARKVRAGGRFLGHALRDAGPTRSAHVPTSL